MQPLNHSHRLEDTPSGKPVESPGRDRRASERYLTVCRIARVQSSADAGLWRVRNISDEGMMFTADHAPAVGEQLEIALSETLVLPGKVMWVKDGLCGVAFAERINAVAALRALADENRSEGHRALRLPVEAEAIATARGASFPIELVDLSHRGAGFRYAGSLEPGSQIEVLLPGGELRRRAIVRWIDGARGGLWFTMPLDRSDLESIARFRTQSIR